MRRSAVLYQAAERVTKSRINWAVFQKNLPESLKAEYRDFISKSQALATSVGSKPDTKPPIDFDYYRKNLSNTKFVDMLEQQYNSVEVPYPKDVDGVSVKIEDAWKEEVEYLKDILDGAQAFKVVQEKMLEGIKMLPSWDVWSVQKDYYYFPNSMNRMHHFPYHASINRDYFDFKYNVRVPYRFWKIVKKVPPPLGEK